MCKVKLMKSITCFQTSEFKDYTKGILGYEPFPTPMSDKPLHQLKKKSLSGNAGASTSGKGSAAGSSHKSSAPASSGSKVKQEKLEDGEVLMVSEDCFISDLKGNL